MSTFRATVVTRFFTNLPEDVWTNTWHFTEVTPIGLSAASVALTPALQTFYQSIYNATTPMANYCVNGTSTIRWYDLSQPEPRVPIFTTINAASAYGVSVVPTEAAAVLSFQADRVPGVPQARQRGRIYLGGLSTAHMVGGTASQYPALSGTTTTSIRSAAIVLQAASVAASCRWSVWSPTLGTASLVTNGWVDNAPDTQRRRSVLATSRGNWP